VLALVGLPTIGLALSITAVTTYVPLLAGLPISVLRPLLSSTHGYAAMWLVCGAAMLASAAFMRPLRSREAEPRHRRRGSGRRLVTGPSG
jgi:hypothetical protein